MKKILCALLLCLTAAGPAAARSDLASTRIDDARKALSEGDFSSALARLNEAERALGFASPVILHLRITAQQVPLEAGHYRYLDLREQRGNCAIYLHEFGINHPADAISPEISRICATLRTFPREALEVVQANFAAQRYDAALDDLTALEKFAGAWSEPQALLKIRVLERWLEGDGKADPERAAELRREVKTYLSQVAAAKRAPAPEGLDYVRALDRALKTARPIVH